MALTSSMTFASMVAGTKPAAVYESTNKRPSAKGTGRNNPDSAFDTAATLPVSTS